MTQKQASPEEEKNTSFSDMNKNKVLLHLTSYKETQENFFYTILKKHPHLGSGRTGS